MVTRVIDRLRCLISLAHGNWPLAKLSHPFLTPMALDIVRFFQVVFTTDCGKVTIRFFFRHLFCHSPLLKRHSCLR